MNQRSDDRGARSGDAPQGRQAATPVDLTAERDARSITTAQWNTLQNLYPGAKPESQLMVWDYCAARQLDPMKKPCHIVPMQVTDGKTGQKHWRDVVLPGIYELRTTAQRTGEYMGHTDAEYGQVVEQFGVKAPEWCSMRIRRWHRPTNQIIEFPVRVLFAECVATKDGRANMRWAKAPVQMLTKCTEAAGIREAFPDELGGTMAEEEISGAADFSYQEAAPAARRQTTTLADIAARSDAGRALDEDAAEGEIVDQGEAPDRGGREDPPPQGPQADPFENAGQKDPQQDEINLAMVRAMLKAATDLDGVRDSWDLVRYLPPNEQAEAMGECKARAKGFGWVEKPPKEDQ